MLGKNDDQHGFASFTVEASPESSLQGEWSLCPCGRQTEFLRKVGSRDIVF